MCGDSKESHAHRTEHSFTPMCSQEEIPDYVNDLNAMHEAVEKLKFGIDRFIWEMERLTKIGHRKDNCEHRPSDYLKLSQAKAAQRAEALLRTIGKWNDSL